MIPRLSNLLHTRLEDKALDFRLRRMLEREAFEAELASGINQFNTAETFMPVQSTTAAEKQQRNTFLEEAKRAFGRLASGPDNNPTVWIARAWSAEVTFEQDDYKRTAEEVAAILRSGMVEAEDGKRLARFFHLRRNFLTALGGRDLQKVIASEDELRHWLSYYGHPRRPTPEVFAVRYYLARVLQSLGENCARPAAEGSEKAARRPRQRAEAI